MNDKRKFVALWRRYEDYRDTPVWERAEREQRAIKDWGDRGPDAIAELENELTSLEGQSP